MAEASKYVFKMEDIAKLLIKEQGLKTGKWTLGANFGVAVMLSKNSDKLDRPAVMTIVEGLSLNQVDPTSPETALTLTFDAAELSK